MWCNCSHVNKCAPVSWEISYYFCLHPALKSSLFFCSCVFLCTPAMVLVMGKEGIHGGQLNKKAFTMAEYLRKSGY